MDAAPEIEILMPGTFTDASGTVVTFASADLDQVAAGFDPAKHPVPVVVGHPALDAPAHGIVTQLRRVGDRLKATLGGLKPDFIAAVKDRRYLRVSPMLFTPQASNSPTPGKWALKHVGFLGAASPAMPGLAPVSFSAEPEGGTATQVLDFNPESLMATNDTAAFAEAQAALAADKASLEAERAAFATQKAALEAERIAAMHAASVAFAETQITAGKLAPAARALVIGLLDQLGAQPDAVAFGEGVTLTPAAAFRKLFDGAHPVVAFGEHARDDRHVGEDSGAVAFAAPAGATVDPARLAVHTRALALQVAEPQLTYEAAVRRIAA